jgi:uncharacterized membrane protein YgdD (TMEM256/DUF423 family)
MKSTTAFRIAAATGFLGVALGAFGAHGLRDVLEKNATTDIWKTASNYHLIHAVVLLFVATLRPFPKTAWLLFFAGVIIFSGSLYVLAATGVKWLGAITPIGGLSLLAGWLALVFRRFSNGECS